MGYGAYKYSQSSTTPVPETAEQAKEIVTGEASKTFTGGDQGFVSLKLDGIEEVNHNTKRFRFALPSPDEVSGLNIACTLKNVLPFVCAADEYSCLNHEVQTLRRRKACYQTLHAHQR